MSVEQRTVIEDLPPKRRGGIALTAVRSGQSGYVVSTVPFWEEAGIFETGTTKLNGYVAQGRDALMDPSWKNGETNIEIYAGDREEALLRHKNAIENAATALEGST